MELLIYVLKVIAIQGVFYAIYYFFLQKKSHHQFNRYYLLTGLLAGILIPFITITETKEVFIDPAMPDIVAIPDSVPEAGYTDYQVSANGEQAKDRINPVLISKVGYAIVAGFLLLRSSFYLLLLFKLRRQSERVEKRWFTLYKTPQDQPFSFFTNVFIPKGIFGTSSYEQILKHECEHVRRAHSFDRLLLDLGAALFWFNPFIYLYRRALIEIHEYQADEAVLRQFNDPIGYQEILYAQLQVRNYGGLVSHFNVKTIKKRIVMMNNQKRRLSKWVLVPIGLITATLIVAFAERSVVYVDTYPPNESNEIQDAASTDVQAQDQYVPSLFPLKNKEEATVSSTFGKRKDPFDGHLKQHRGLDLRTPIGNPVIATADGVVAKASVQKSGYGKMITLQHGEEYQTRYGQLSVIGVEEGDRVKKGDIIGESGNSGRSTGPHLHYEVIHSGENVDPMKYIPDYGKEDVGSEEQTTTSEGENARVQEGTSAILYKGNIYRDASEIPDLAGKTTTFKLLSADEISRRIGGSYERVIELTDVPQFIVDARIERDSELYDQYGPKVKRRLNTEKTPLFLVNGGEMSASDVALLDPSYFKDIEVFYPNEAFVKYGEKGMNGAVLIQTNVNKKRKLKDKNKVKGKNKEKKKGTDGYGLTNGSEGVFTVVLDPGNGGFDQGAVSNSGKFAKDINLEIVQKIVRKVRPFDNIRVVATRTEDHYLDVESRIAQSEGADLFISFQADRHTDETINQSLVMYSENNREADDAKALACMINEGILDTGRESQVGYSSYRLLTEVPCPSIRLVTGFISNNEGEAYLTSSKGQEEMAQTILNIILYAANS